MLEARATNLVEHPAIAAWRRLGTSPAEPLAVQTISHTQKSQVYRLAGAGPEGQPVIAKRCVRKTAHLESAIYDRILSMLPISNPRYFGTVGEGSKEFSWLFLEDAGDRAYDDEASTDRLRFYGEKLDTWVCASVWQRSPAFPGRSRTAGKKCA